MPSRPRLRNVGAPLSRSSSTSSRAGGGVATDSAPQSTMLFLRSPQPSGYAFGDPAPAVASSVAPPKSNKWDASSTQQHDDENKELFRRTPLFSSSTSATTSSAQPSATLPLAAQAQRCHGSDDAEIYHRRWSHVVMGATSGILFSIACFVAYCCYLLMSPYMGGISFGVLLSIVLHPKTRHDKLARAGLCVSKMESVNAAWGPIHAAPSLPNNSNSKFTIPGKRKSPAPPPSVPLASLTRSLPLWLSKWIGSMVSLVPFVRHAIYEGALFMGMQKLPSVIRRSSSSKKKVGSLLHVSVAGCATSIAIFVSTAAMLTGLVPFVLLHVALLVLFLLLVPILSEKSFAYYMERLWKFALMSYFCCGLMYCFFSDVVVVTQTVQHTTSVVVESSRSIVTQRANWTELIQMRNKVLSDFVVANNLTDVVEHMKQLEPLLANLSSSIHEVFSPSSSGADVTNGSATTGASPVNGSSSGFARGTATFNFGNWTEFVRHVQEAYHRLQSPSSEQDGVTSLITTAFTSLTDKSRYLGVALLTLVLKVVENVVNVFDGVYEMALFVFVFKYLTQLRHTVVYYLIDKMLSPLHHPMAKDHATAIERDITISFETLFQSFWHITWFHFCSTFCCFRLWGSPLPFFSGLVAVAMALFPFVPKWFSPCMIKFFVLLGDRVMNISDDWSTAFLLVWDYELLTFAAIGYLVMKDEWLLSVERGLRGASRQDSRGVVREQLPTFLVGTCIILGLVVYGLRGVLLGPLTVIVARTLFDNWDSLSSGMLPMPAFAVVQHSSSSGKTQAAHSTGAATENRAKKIHQDDAASSPLFEISPFLAPSSSSATVSRNGSFSMTMSPSKLVLGNNGSNDVAPSAAAAKRGSVTTATTTARTSNSRDATAAARDRNNVTRNNSDDEEIKSYDISRTPELLVLKKKQ
ncbi:transmembrane protein, putative [Bodo saltans]|uniref:Transmembrane protein, putative n=1 Tax=Bodo saltans TaxID=75058 RepID=A0A0S4JVG0_BODSA|nr:transmembrane protein, putative [Bodo saltans]|eukprot:CUG94294.1 transmembrane protein, putative [Bodo saltans]